MDKAPEEKPAECVPAAGLHLLVAEGQETHAEVLGGLLEMEEMT